MKFTCTQENFKKAIYNSERVVAKQSTLPILNNILFETEKGGLRVSATNLEIGVSNQVGARIEREGRITIPAKLISNFINNLSQEENISIETSEQGMKIKSGTSKAIIKGLSAEEFPLLPKKTTEFLLIIPANRLKEIILKIMPCVALNETRQELTGVNVLLGEKALFFAATDSFRLAELRFELAEENINKAPYLEFIQKNTSLIIPANTLLEVARVIGNDEDGQVKIALEEGQIFFELDGTSIVSRLINGKYPEYKHILPKEFKTRAVVEKNVLQGMIKMASIFANGKTNEIVIKIDDEEGKVIIDARSVEIGENTSELKTDVVGTAQEVVFNSKYLLDGLNTITTSKVAVLVNGPATPVALKEIDPRKGEVLEDYVYIVMPIKN